MQRFNKFTLNYDKAWFHQLYAVTEFTLRQAPIQSGHDNPCLGRRQLNFYVFGAVACQKGNPISLFETHPHHQLGQSIGSLFKLAVCPICITIDNGDLIRMCSYTSVKHGTDI